VLCFASTLPLLSDKPALYHTVKEISHLGITGHTINVYLSNIWLTGCWNSRHSSERSVGCGNLVGNNQDVVKDVLIDFII